MPNRLKIITNTNRTIANRSGFDYITIHYVGAVSSAKSNGNYFLNSYRGASAHYFVDEYDIVQVVEEKDIAWHCGTNGAYYNSCRNSNSIGIELCCKKDANGNWYFEQETLNNAIELVKELLSRQPNAILCRHYDVTRKICPQPFVKNEEQWNDFKFRCYNQPVPPIVAQPNILMIVTPTYKIGCNLRSGAGTAYSKVGALAYGQNTNIYEIIGNWGRTNNGYICLSYARDINKQVIKNENKYKLGRYVVNAYAGLNVRAGAGTGYAKIKTYKNGTVFDTYNIINNWAKTPSGWVCLDYCKLIYNY
ncbi:MAG: N-acetylmuramoyl-L-alanine amidase [Clostridia bacterium]